MGINSEVGESCVAEAVALGDVDRSEEVGFGRGGLWIDSRYFCGKTQWYSWNEVCVMKIVNI